MALGKLLEVFLKKKVDFFFLMENKWEISA